MNRQSNTFIYFLKGDATIFLAPTYLEMCVRTTYLKCCQVLNKECSIQLSQSNFLTSLFNAYQSKFLSRFREHCIFWFYIVSRSIFFPTSIYFILIAHFIDYIFCVY